LFIPPFYTISAGVAKMTFSFQTIIYQYSILSN
jgi:hypothetical protein